MKPSRNARLIVPNMIYFTKSAYNLEMGTNLVVKLYVNLKEHREPQGTIQKNTFLFQNWFISPSGLKIRKKRHQLT